MITRKDFILAFFAPFILFFIPKKKEEVWTVSNRPHPDSNFTYENLKAAIDEFESKYPKKVLLSRGHFKTSYHF